MLSVVFNAVSFVVYTACFLGAMAYFVLKLKQGYEFEVADVFMVGVACVMIVMGWSSFKALRRRIGERSIARR